MLVSERMAESNVQVDALVRKCILDVPSISLRRHILSCLVKMHNVVKPDIDPTVRNENVVLDSAREQSL